MIRMPVTRDARVGYPFDSVFFRAIPAALEFSSESLQKKTEVHGEWVG